ncbi:hypothetical protein PYCC9005_000614 [Savitreella phatthalungensis]
MLLKSLVAFAACASAIASDLNGTWTDLDPIDLGYVKIQGRLDSGSNIKAWIGVRYSDPVKRFRKGVLPSTTNDSTGAVLTLRADAYGPSCPQPGDNNTVVGSEDCLFLNIWAPDGEFSEPLPVFIHTFGGAGIVGGGDANPRRFMKIYGRPFIFISYNMRVNIFGQLASPVLKQAGLPQNVGVWDAVVMLEWVQQNIAKFGGNPRKVTIWGFSSGSGIVSLLTEAKGGAYGDRLFDKVILQSPAAFTGNLARYDDQHVIDSYNNLTKLVKCDASAPAAAQIDCLAKVPVPTMLQYGMDNGRVEVIDDDLVVDTVGGYWSTSGAKANGNLLLITTTTGEEGRQAVNVTSLSETYKRERELFSSFHLTDADYEEMDRLYPRLPQFNTSFQQDRLMYLEGDNNWGCWGQWLGRRWPAGKAFRYQLARPPVFHGSDYQSFMPDAKDDKPEHLPFDKVYLDAWLSFVIDGAPRNNLTGEMLPPFIDSVNQKEGNYVRFNTSDDAQQHPTVDVLPESQWNSAALPGACQFWFEKTYPQMLGVSKRKVQRG